MEIIVEKYSSSFGIEKKFWLGLILAYYARCTGSKVADKCANDILDETEDFMMSRYHRLPPKQ